MKRFLSLAVLVVALAFTLIQTSSAIACECGDGKECPKGQSCKDCKCINDKP